MCAPAATPCATAASVPASRSRGGRPVSAPTKSLRETASSSGRPELVQLAERAQHLDRLRRRLAEVRPGIERSAARTPRRAERASAIRSAGSSRTSSTTSSSRLGSSSFCLGAARVCISTSAGAGLSADVGQLGVAQAADVVDDRRAGGDRGARHRRLVGVDRDERAELAGDRSISGTTRSISSSALDRRTVGDARLAADVDHVGAVREQRSRQRDAVRRASRARPPSENESGVALTIPISHGRPPSSTSPRVLAQHAPPRRDHRRDLRRHGPSASRLLGRSRVDLERGRARSSQPSSPRHHLGDRARGPLGAGAPAARAPPAARAACGAAARRRRCAPARARAASTPRRAGRAGRRTIGCASSPRSRGQREHVVRGVAVAAGERA